MSLDIEPLQALLGDKGLLNTPAEMAAHVTDLLGAEAVNVLAVARPDTVAQVSETVRWCHENGAGLVMQGGLTGLVNGAIPGGGAPVLIVSLGRLNTIGQVDSDDNTVVVEAGAILAHVKQAAEAAGRYLPLSHGGEGSSQIGGNLSTDAGGNNALRYGTVRDQVLGLEVVLPDGTVWNGLRSLRKDTAGFDLKHLFLGAEGTLGIITRACLMLRPLPRARETALLALPSPAAALTFLRTLEREAGETLAAFELMSAAAIARALTMEGTRPPFNDAHDWLALIELETPALRFDLQGALEDAIGQGLEDGLIADAVIAQASQHRADFWRLREAIADALIEETDSLKADTAVPVGKVPEFIAAAHLAVEAVVPGARCVPFGHLGDGNIHFNVRRPEAMSPTEFRANWETVTAALDGVALGLGGTISAEHGIGRLKRASFQAVASAEEWRLLDQLKRALDPARIMNPGVIFDETP